MQFIHSRFREPALARPGASRTPISRRALCGGALLFTLLWLQIGPVAAADPYTPAELLQKVAHAHPRLRTADARIKRLKAEIQRAAQSPNPELESRVLGGGDSLSAEAGFHYTFETADKYERRIDLAREDLALAENERDLLRQNLVAEAALALVRLRQVFRERELLKETVESYKHAVRRMRAFPRLSPENQVSLGTYHIAAEEVSQRLAHLDAEAEQLISGLRFASGATPAVTDPQSDSVARLAATTALKGWPQMENRPAEAETAQSAEEKLARRRTARARAALEVEESLAYPNLSIGPTLEYRREGGDSSIPGPVSGGSGNRSATELGLSFRITLPLFHSNDGGQAAARAGVAEAQTNAEGVDTRLAFERSSQLALYRRATKSLQSGLSKERLARLHRELHAVIGQGRASPAIVIEFHRSQLELQATRHATELAAYRALLSIYSLDGVFLQKVEAGDVPL